MRRNDYPQMIVMIVKVNQLRRVVKYKMFLSILGRNDCFMIVILCMHVSDLQLEKEHGIAQQACDHMKPIEGAKHMSNIL